MMGLHVKDAFSLAQGGVKNSTFDMPEVGSFRVGEKLMAIKMRTFMLIPCEMVTISI